MTFFEYLAIAYSLVISFSVVRVASVLPHVIGSDRQYWVHTVFVLANLMLCLVIFWNSWSYREVVWTLGLFSLALTLPTSVFIMASILAPDEPAQVVSWREYFYSTRVKIYVANILLAVAIMASTSLILRMPIHHPLRLLHVSMLGLSVVGALSDRPRVHEGIASLTILFFLFAALRFFSEPGALASIP